MCSIKIGFMSLRKERSDAIHRVEISNETRIRIVHRSHEKLSSLAMSLLVRFEVKEDFD